MLRVLLRVFPQSLHLLGFRMTLAYLIRRNPGLQNKLTIIEGKSFRLEASDIGKSYSFYVKNGQVKVFWKGLESPDVVMRGAFGTLWDLLCRRADADSLFFSRKLVVEGDVQASMFLKNLIESL